MFEHIKKRIIKGLIEEIECLDAVGLELVGHNVISILEHRRMIHHGINKDYKPSGYTVDSFSNDSTIVTEYSTKKDYFQDKSPQKSPPIYQKIETDIKHAIKHKTPDGPNKIYLVSNQKEPPSFRSKFNTTSIAGSYGDRVIIIDSRELAKSIYDQSIGNSSHADFYKEFFPGFSQDIDNYEYYGKIPARCENHISDAGLLDVISHHYEEGHNVCVLYGVSGSGKTQASIDFIHNKGRDFENYIWISGDDWKRDTSLNSIQRSRGGSPINVAGIFNSAKTILIIDSIERCIEKTQFVELESGFKRGGIVLATSQIATPGSPIYLAMPALSQDVATQILGEDPLYATETCEKFVKLCRFLPLILSTARNIAELEGIARDVFYKEILDAPEEISGPDGTSAMRRILAKLEAGTLDGLRKVANSGTSVHDLVFLRDFLGVNPCTNLQRLSLLLPTSTPGVMKVHDLVCLAIRDDLNSKVIAEAVEGFIGKYYGEMTPSVLREIHLTYNQIYDEHIRRGERNPDWLTYGLLQVEGEVKQEIHEKIFSIPITPDLSLASVMCTIDAKEVHSYTIESSDSRRSYYKQCAEEFEKALEEVANENVKAELLHHRAKALRRCGQYQEALSCFTQLLELKPEWHAIYGQIAHLGIQRGVGKHIHQRGEESLRLLMASILEGASAVPLRVSLAAFAKLRSYPNLVRELSSRPDDVQKLADVISISALEGFGQFYEAFVSFTSIFGYHHSLCCVSLAESLPEMLAMPPELVERKQWISACEALANTAIAAKRRGKRDFSSRIADASIKFADAVSACEELKSFDARAVAKAYTTAGMHREALEAIAKVPVDRIDHWLLYRKSEAQLAVGEQEEALQSAIKALDLAAKDPRAESRLSSYHDLKSQCHEALGDKGAALVEARHALEKCEDGQYKQAIMTRILSLESALS
ncbi:MAG: tetratricopeptide repeat protein [Nitrospiraceae bacterium]|nr:tetratricopeptide repeat protein [Nitrospiraceae bacterium]